MLSRLIRLIGLKPEPSSAPGAPSRPSSATAHLFEKRPAQPAERQRPNVETEGDFNPYNTGKFDRSASWERISKNQR